MDRNERRDRIALCVYFGFCALYLYGLHLITPGGWRRDDFPRVRVYPCENYSARVDDPATR